MIAAPPKSRSCVMVVDDSPTALCSQAAFESADYDVVPATDGLEGLRKVEERKPDVIVTDSIMPGLDGFGFLRRLRESASTRLIPEGDAHIERRGGVDGSHGEPQPDPSS